MTNTSKPSESLEPDSLSPQATIFSDNSQSKIVPFLKSSILTLLKNIPTFWNLLKKSPTKSVLALLTTLLGGGATQEGLRTNAWRMVGGTLDSAPLGGHRIYYDFRNKSVTSEFVLSKKMRDNIANNPIKEIKIDITFDPEQNYAQLWVKDMKGNYDQIKLSRTNGTLLNPNEKDKFSFTVGEKDINKAHRDILSVISIDATDLGSKKGTFIVENIAMK